MNIYEKICDIIKETLFLDEDFEFNEELTFSEFEADSIDMVDIIMSVEDSFNIEISDEELEKIKSLKELAELVAEKV